MNNGEYTIKLDKAYTFYESSAGSIIIIIIHNKNISANHKTIRTYLQIIKKNSGRIYMYVI